jgi:hypothetical protein
MIPSVDSLQLQGSEAPLLRCMHGAVAAVVLNEILSLSHRVANGWRSLITFAGTIMNGHPRVSFSHSIYGLAWHTTQARRPRADDCHDCPRNCRLAAVCRACAM